MAESSENAVMSIEAARAALANGAVGDAENILRARLDDAADDIEARVLLADILSAHGKLHEAKALLEPFVASISPPELLQMLGLIHYELQEFGPCEIYLDRLVASHPTITPARTFFVLAKLKANTGRVADAREVLNVAIAAHPKRTDLVSWRASILHDDSKACAELEAYLETNTLDPPATSEILKALTAHRAALMRKAQGLRLEFGSSWEDTCTWPDLEGIARLE